MPSILDILTFKENITFHQEEKMYLTWKTVEEFVEKVKRHRLNVFNTGPILEIAIVAYFFIGADNV